MRKIKLYKYEENMFYHDIIESLVTALEAKDNYTKGHSDRVADMSYSLAKALGFRGMALEEIHIAAHLHDIGKIGIPDAILNKEGKLSPEEYECIKIHPTIGCDILCKSKYLKTISEIVLHHHERWDGKGYPNGLEREEIPIGARIIAVCDSIDAMTSNRPYRRSLSFKESINEIIRNKGIMYDPIIVELIRDNIDIVKNSIIRYH